MLNHKLPESKSSSSITNLDQLPLIKVEPKSAPIPPQVKVVRVFRLVMAFSAVITVGLIATKHYSQVRSRQAFINAEIVSVRNPIAGNLQLKNLQPGQLITSGENIGAVKNLREGAELEVTKQGLISQIEQAKQTLVSLDAQIANRRQLIAQVEAEASNQQSLGVDYEMQQLEIVQNQLNHSLFVAQTAQKDQDRLQALADQGVIAQDKVERSQLNYNRAQNMVKSARSQLKQAQQKIEAAKAGLQLDGSKTLGYSEIRQRELQTEISDLQQQQAEVAVRQQTTEAELAKINRQLSLNQRAVITSPTDGTVWSVESKTGEYADPSTPILELLNCQNRWVEAFFSEQNTEKLYPGRPVDVRLLGTENNQFVSGTIESVRAGSGRVETGKDIAVPPPNNVRRQVAVRVKLNELPEVDSVQFCDVGRSAEVVFNRGSL
ncbi:MAG: HlyD family secretion protein [Pleurocapsa sp.]